jgi:hypothetical protein
MMAVVLLERFGDEVVEDECWMMGRILNTQGLLIQFPSNISRP